MYFLYNLLQKDSGARKLTYISTAKVINSERLKLYLDIKVARELIMYLNFLWTRPAQPVVAGDMLPAETFIMRNCLLTLSLTK